MESYSKKFQCKVRSAYGMKDVTADRRGQDRHYVIRSLGCKGEYTLFSFSRRVLLP